MDIIFWTQVVSIVILVYTLYLLMVWSRRDRTRRLWAISVGITLLHALLFYLYVIVVKLVPEFPKLTLFSSWSAILRLQTYIVIAMVAWALNKLNGRLDGHHDD